VKLGRKQKNRTGVISHRFSCIYMRGGPIVSPVTSSRRLESLKWQCKLPMQSVVVSTFSSRPSTQQIQLLKTDYGPQLLGTNGSICYYLLRTSSLSRPAVITVRQHNQRHSEPVLHLLRLRGHSHLEVFCFRHPFIAMMPVKCKVGPDA